MPPKRYFEEQGEKAADAEAAGSSSAARQNTTLFVSRLPFTATSVDLQTLFSDVGPLKRAFVVTDQETKKSKGVGYVTFAVAEDAERALTELQGKKLDGKRAIAVSWADDKPTRKERAEGAGAPPVKRPRVAVPAGQRVPATPRDPSSSSSASKDPDAVRTLILSGLQACTPPADAKTLYKRARKIGDVDNVIYPGPSPQGGPKPDPDVAHVIFRTPNHAATAVTKLHAHTFKGALLSAVLKRRADGVAKLNARMRPETRERMEKRRKEVEEASKGADGSIAHLPAVDSIPVAGISQESRLIIRNLPWDVTTSDLRAVFLPFGPIYKIDIPQALPKTGQQPSKPAAVQVETLEDTIKVEDGAEEKDSEEGDESEEEDSNSHDDETGSDSSDSSSEDDEHSVASSPEESDTLPKSTPSAAPAAPAAAKTKGRGFGFVWLVSRSDAARALEGVNGKPIRHGEAEKIAAKTAKGSKGRLMAKEKLKEVRESAQPERIVAVDWALTKDEWKKKEEETDGEETEADGDADDDDLEDGSDDDAGSEEDEEEDVKPALPTPSEGTTLFVRNLPFEATEPELLTLFKQFGAVRYARITMDRSTNPPRSKGTGFVCFWTKEAAVEALQRARDVEQEAGSGITAPPLKAGQNPFSMTSVLTVDPSAPLTASFNIRGRILNVIPAVEREKADSLTAAGIKARQKQDKRNTHLMREGVPLPNTPMAEQLASNPNEIEKRLGSFSQRRSQLSINPSLYISKTRLSIRQLPLFCTDRMLKRLAIHAIKAFKAEVAEGKRQDLDVDELADRTFSLASKPPKKGERSTSVVQSKIVRAIDRPDPMTGVGRSKGFGFLEMRSFGEALRALRWLNANKDVQKLMIEWYIEELEDLRKKLEGEIAEKDSSSGSGLVDKVKNKPSSSTPGSGSSEDLPSRLKRVLSKQAELKESGARSVDKAERGGLLFVEFSIENATVVKARQDRVEQNRKNAERRTLRDANGGSGGGMESTAAPASFSDEGEEEDGEPEAEEDVRGKRLPKRANWNQSTKKRGSEAKSAASVGSNGAKGSKRDETRVRKVKEQASDKVGREGGAAGDKLGNKLGSLIGRKRKDRKKGAN
ncbi:hypothetical protein BCV69DRAFT_265448 [Microstroma glucosiphilum]|uniref:RRM domain-containing protein n=1 Tax=Pseudomicrostroma glucosiphilum TaxID=1684307 RepID=A0A316UJA6_9BASI|nr:hypothetical protein BCV69DRAFT_265448 [Pseudomicrostroma glucosiphilum]PWN24023.1 hypothetical protein BCV69DRAFT_265448 [Pseudomicrostroma glucosiphilum]